MAVNPNDLTVSYRTLQAMPFRDRRALMYSGFADQVNAALTPSQRANLFPSYYRQEAAAAQSALTGVTNLSKAEYLNKARNNAGVSYGDANKLGGKPEDKGPPKITASEFRAVESNPFLAGYVDKTTKVQVGAAGVKETGIGELGDSRQQRMKMVYDSFTNAGFSHKQSLALTAEVGRENGFQEKYMFGTHSDPYNSATNLGMLSMQGSRLSELKEYLAYESRFDASGNLIPDQETMNSMARFYMNEMKTSEKSKMTEAFLANPNIDPKEAGYLLGKGYIRWRYDDPQYATHHQYRDQYYNEIDNITSDFATVVDETTEKPDAMSVVTKVAEEIPTASELKIIAENLDINATTESALGFLNNKERNPDGANLVEVDPRLLEIAEMGIRKFEAENPNLKVEIYGPGSGKRTSSVTQKSQHLDGKALDFEIFEVDPKTGMKTGKRLANFSNQTGAGEAGDEYLKLHQNIELARIYKKDVIKDSRYVGVYGRSGALFGGEYAFDTQHYDIGGQASSNGITSAAQPGGDIFGGYSEEYMRRFGVESSAAMPIETQNITEFAKIAYGPKETVSTAVATSTPELKTPVLPKEENSVSKADIAPTSTDVIPPVTPTPVTAASTATEMPKANTTPIKTMAQGGIINPIGDSEIVTRSPTTGEVTQRTKVAEYGTEQIKVEPLSKMNADALTPQINNVSSMPESEKPGEVSPQENQPAQRASMTSSRLPSVPYSNIDSEVRRPTGSALRAALQIRMNRTSMGDYIA